MIKNATKKTKPKTKGGINEEAKYLVVTFSIDCAILPEEEFFNNLLLTATGVPNED